MNQNLKFLGLLLISCFVLVGCHFVGDPSASHEVSGFFKGLWDGAIILFSVVMTCFTDVQIIELNNNGFFYKVGYAIGVICFAWNIGIACGIISLLTFILPF